MNPLNNKRKISRCNVGRNFIGKKTVQMPQKNIVMIYEYINN